MGRKNVVAVIVWTIVSLTSAQAQWVTPIVSGTVNDATTDYLNTANWTSGTINDTFLNNPVPAGPANIYFNADYTTGNNANGQTGYGLWFAYGGNSNLTLLGGGTNSGATAAAHTLTLMGDIYLGNSGNPVTIIGSTIATTALNVNLGGGTRTITASASGKTLQLLSGVSNGNLVITNGVTLVMGGTNTTYNGNIYVKDGSLLSTGNSTTANYLGTGTIFLGANAGTANATFGHTNGGTNYSNAIVVVGGNTGTASIAPTNGNDNYTGAITLQNHDLRIAPSTNGNITFSGGITGTGNLLIQQSVANTTTTFQTGTLNFQGSITNTSNQGGANGVRIQSVIGNKVTSVIQSGSLTMTLSASNSYTGGTVINTGTLATSGVGTLGIGNVLVADVTGAVLVLGNNSSIADTATLSFGHNSIIYLNGAGVEIIGSLFDLTNNSYINALTLNTPYTAAALNSALGISVFQGSGALEITTIPEPSTFALLIFGAGLLGALSVIKCRKA